MGDVSAHKGLSPRQCQGQPTCKTDGFDSVMAGREKSAEISFPRTPLHQVRNSILLRQENKNLVKNDFPVKPAYCGSINKSLTPVIRERIFRPLFIFKYLAIRKKFD